MGRFANDRLRKAPSHRSTRTASVAVARWSPCRLGEPSDPEYLEAMAAWLQVYKHSYTNQGQPVPADGWTVFAPCAACGRYIRVTAQHDMRQMRTTSPEAPMYKYTGLPLARWTLTGDGPGAQLRAARLITARRPDADMRGWAGQRFWRRGVQIVLLYICPDHPDVPVGVCERPPRITMAWPGSSIRRSQSPFAQAERASLAGQRAQSGPLERPRPQAPCRGRRLRRLGADRAVRGAGCAVPAR
jgi:hypothetical protein